MPALHTKDDVTTNLEAADRIPIYRSTLDVWQLIALEQLNGPFAQGFPSAGTKTLVWGKDDFISVGDGLSGYFVASSGTGSIGTNKSVTDAGRTGEIQLSGGTATSGYGVVYGGNVAETTFGSGRRRIRWDVSVPVASDATDDFNVFVGWSDAAFTGTGTDSVGFFYNHGTNSGQWVCYTKAGGVATTSNTTVAVAAAGYQVLEIEVNAAASSVSFYIDGTSVVTPHTTNIPTGTSQATRMCCLTDRNNNGSTARYVFVDLCYWSFEPTTPL